MCLLFANCFQTKTLCVVADFNLRLFMHLIFSLLGFVNTLNTHNSHSQYYFDTIGFRSKNYPHKWSTRRRSLTHKWQHTAQSNDLYIYIYKNPFLCVSNFQIDGAKNRQIVKRHQKLNKNQKLRQIRLESYKDQNNALRTILIT